MGNKKAIVTGGSRGIGHGIVLKLAQNGYDVAFSYNTKEDEAKELKELVEREYGVKAFYHQASLERKGVPDAFFGQAVQDLGGLDLLVCNAGITRFGSLFDLDEDEMDKLLALDYKSYLLLSRDAARYMADNGIKGNIIYISSIHGLRAYSFDVLYGSVKAALIRAVQSEAIELGHYGIRVNAIAPGQIKIRTNEDIRKETGREAHYDEYEETFGKMIPLGRVGTPEDIAKAVLFLASDQARYITGITIRVDGCLILPGMPESTDPRHNVRIWGYHEKY